MPLHASSYFAGVATVVGTMAFGFGGGVLMTDAFLGKSDNPPTLIERRNAPLPEASSPVTSAAADPAPQQSVPAAAEPPQQAAAGPAAAPTSPQDAAKPAAPQPAVAAQTAAQPQSTPAWQGSVSAPQERSRQPDQDAASAQEAEANRKAAERRKAERRKWAERRRQENRRIEEMNAVAERVRRFEQEREPMVRSFAADGPRIVLPGFDD